MSRFNAQSGIGVAMEFVIASFSPMGRIRLTNGIGMTFVAVQVSPQSLSTKRLEFTNGGYVDLSTGAYAVPDPGQLIVSLPPHSEIFTGEGTINFLRFS